jgi:D-3-phosphoglycerate dehydrogenase
MKPVVVVTDCDHPSIEIERDVFSRAGIALRTASCRSAADVVTAGAGADGLLSQYAPITDAVMAALPTVRVLGRYGVGLDNIDLRAAERRGLSVVNVPDYCTDEVADHTLGLVLCLTRGLVSLDRAVRRGIWDFRVAGEVRRTSGLRLGIVGFGRIGRAVSRRALASRFQVVAYDPAFTQAEGVSFSTFSTLLATSDVITLHAPLNPSTRNLIDASAFASMKPGALFVNTARGGLVDQRALTDALASGHLGGAALDVLEPEPISLDDPLLGFPNVILSSHAAFYSRDSIVEMKRRVAEEMVSALALSADSWAVAERRTP